MSPKQFRFHVIYRNLCFVFVALGILFTLTFLITAVTNAAPLMHSNEGHNYYVQYGDTLSEIAQMHGLSTAELRRANALSNADHIHSGDILYIPSTSSQHGQSCRYHHEVSSGQSLSWIAVSYGIDIASLAQANHIHDYDNIKFGQSLCIPVYNSTPNTPAPKTIPTTAPTPVPTIYVPPTSTVNPLSYYPEPNGYVYYTLRLGDTLGTLASRYQTTEHHITVLNPTANIAIGTILLLPIYDEIPAPPTQTPLFYPTIISMSPTQTPLFYPTLVPPPATTIPVATTTPVPPSATQPSAATPLVPTATPLVPTIIRPPATTMPPTAMPPPTSTSLPTAILPPTTTPMPPTTTPIPPTTTPAFAGPSNPWTGQYYINPNLRGESLYTRSDANVDFNWGDGGPGFGIPNEKFSVRWMTHEQFQGGQYIFRATVEGGIRLYVDGEQQFAEWRDQSGSFMSEVELEEGYHTVQIDFSDQSANASIRAWWTKK